MTNLDRKISILDIQKYGIDFSNATNEVIKSALEAANDDFIERKEIQHKEEVNEYLELTTDSNLNINDWIDILKRRFDVDLSVKRKSKPKDDKPKKHTASNIEQSDKLRKPMTPACIYKDDDGVIHEMKNRGKQKSPFLGMSDERKNYYRVTHSIVNEENECLVWCESSGIDKPDWVCDETLTTTKAFGE